MNEERVQYSSLPEDLEPLQRRHNGRLPVTEPSVTISSSGIFLNKPAQALLGNPRRTEVLFGPKSRMVAIRPADAKAGYSCVAQVRGEGVRLGYDRVLERFGLPPQRKYHPLRLEAHLVEGALLVGPLPEATS